MELHLLDQLLPEFLATLLVNAFVADHRKFLRARCDKDQDRIPFLRLVHPELDEFLLRSFQRVLLEFPALKENADLSRGLRFGLLDRANDAIVLEFTKKSVGAHQIYQLPLEPPPPKLPPP